MMRVWRILLCATVSGAAHLACGATLDAQSVHRACRVPNVGAIYMIGMPGVPPSCIDPSHIEFSWSEGGTAPVHSGLAGLLSDDHPQYLLAGGLRTSNGGFAVAGNLSSGAPIPGQGPGVRFLWWPERAALRAGQVTSGQWDSSLVGLYSVAFGRNPIASGLYSMAVGSAAVAAGQGAIAVGTGSQATGVEATALGPGSLASGVGSVAISVGPNGSSSGPSSVAIGGSSLASGNGAMALMGGEASGEGSVAVGWADTRGWEGAMVFGDRSNLSAVQAVAANQFVARAAGGFRFYTNRTLTAGVALNPGAGAWATLSDRDMKRDFRYEDPESYLSALSRLAVQSWSYVSQEATIRHIGPVAQDFFDAFGLGESDRTITTTDIDGVSILAIQALERRTADLRTENKALLGRLRSLEQSMQLGKK